MAFLQTGSFDVVSEFRDFVFARFVEDLNIRERGTDAPLKNYIKAREAKEIHDRLTSSLQSISADAPFGRQVTAEQFNAALADAFGDRLPEDFDAARFSQYAASQFQDFSAYMQTGLVPVSPYADRWRDQETVMNHGSEILYLRGREVMDYTTGSWDFSQQASDDETLRPKLYRMRFRNADTGAFISGDGRTNTWEMSDVGFLTTDVDLTNISQLKEFMTEAEFADIKGWMDVPPEKQMSRDMMARSVGILRYLREHDYVFSIVRDMNRGQLKAVVNSPRMDIRITDVRNKVTVHDPVTGEAQERYTNGKYIGRVYRDGVEMIPNFGTKTRVGEADALLALTPEQTIDFVRYCLGEPVERRGLNTNSYQNANANAPRNERYIGTRSEGRRDEKIRRSTYWVASKKSGQIELRTVLGRHTYYDENGQPLVTDQQGHAIPLWPSVQTRNGHSRSHIVFRNDASATDYLRTAIATARQNFLDKVNIDYLIREYEAHQDDPDYVPVFSGDTSVAPIQLRYWNVLRGAAELFKPEGAITRDAMFDSIFSQLSDDEPDELDTDDIDVSSVRTEYDVHQEAERYTGTPEEKIRAHLSDSMDMLFGTFEPNDAGKRFSASMTAMFMESANGTARNKDNIIAAMQRLGFTGDELLGDDFETGTIRDKLLKYDENSAKKLVDLAQDSRFYTSVLYAITGALQTSGCEVSEDDIMIDDMGVVSYKAKLYYTKSPDGFLEVNGQIGQIFAPDEDGLLETHYNGSQNRLFIPQYEAYVIPEDESTRGKPMGERIRLRGLEQVLVQNLRGQIRHDLHELQDDSSNLQAGDVIHVGTTTSVNGSYRSIPGATCKIGIAPEPGESMRDTYFRQALHGQPEDFLKANLATKRDTVQFRKDFVESTFMSSWDDSVPVCELTNDNCLSDPLVLTNGQDLTIPLNEQERGYLYHIGQAAMGQGRGLPMTEHASLADDPQGRCRIIPSDIPDDGSARANWEGNKYRRNQPSDRGQMTNGSLSDALGIQMETRIAQCNMQGWTFDDGCIISRSFAERCRVVPDPTSEDGYRPLMAGDKICDMAGNKSVISIVIDDIGNPNATEQEKIDEENAARKGGYDDALATFRANPGLDVIQAPYAGVSRFNAASGLFGMDNHMDLRIPDKKAEGGCRIIPGGISVAPMIVTEHNAEKHIKNYDDEDVRQGKGRKFSAQAGWIGCARSGHALMRTVFGSNIAAVINFREYLIVMGFDMSPDGRILNHYEAHPDEKRYIFNLPSDETMTKMADRDIVKLFQDSVGSHGGFMELPFPLRFPTSDHDLQEMPAESASRDGTYMLPVLSSHLRSGQTFEDGTKSAHDYTNQYAKIYADAVKYLKAKPEERVKYVQDAQRAFSSIALDVEKRKFLSKHNIVRDELMARRMPNSATSVWLPRPDLELNQIAMSSEMAAKLGVQAGDHVLVNRDPMLRVDGMHDMVVVIDDNMKGVGVSPTIAAAYNGDFDGDSVGIRAYMNQEEAEECYRLYSFDQNLLDFSHKGEDGKFDLFINTTMDVQTAISVDQARYDSELASIQQSLTDPYMQKVAIANMLPSLGERLADLRDIANEIYQDSTLSDEERAEKNRDLLHEMSNWNRAALRCKPAAAAVSFENAAEICRSQGEIVESGAKGSWSKLASYIHYMGYECDHVKNPDGTDGEAIDPASLTYVGPSIITDDEIQGTFRATGIKSYAVGRAGAISQQVVMCLRDHGLASQFGQHDTVHSQNALERGLRLTYCATQGLLQAKHDPKQAVILYRIVTEDLQDLWNGYKMEKSYDADGYPRWKAAKDSDGKPIKATKEEWIESFKDIHCDKKGLGLDINPDDVQVVADVLADNTGHMCGIRDEKFVNESASLLDILAYRQKTMVKDASGSYKGATRLVDVVTSGSQLNLREPRLFDGEETKWFAPDAIRRNMDIADGKIPGKMVAIQAPDTKPLGASIDVSKAAMDIEMRQTAEQVTGRAAGVAQPGGFNPDEAVKVIGSKAMRFDAEPQSQESKVPLQREGSSVGNDILENVDKQDSCISLDIP